MIVTTLVGLGRTLKKMSAKKSLVLYELKQHKPWFDEECLRILDQRKRAKINWLQDPNQRNISESKN